MNIWKSKTYRSDLERVLNTINLDRLKGKKILITGATGLIGSAIVDLLLLFNQKQQGNLQIYAASRSVKKITERFHGNEEWLIPVQYDATENPNFNFSVDFIIHGASNASPDKYVSEPVDTLMANILGVHNLLQYGMKCELTKFVYVSSSEVYGKLSHGKPMVENQYGFVDILSPRASYPMGKQASESICIAYANQYSMDVSIVRPGHIYGPTAQESDNRISSAFVRQAAMNNNLTMKSMGTQLRSYCYCLDCASAILTVLLKGETQQAYNISNRDSIITIRQMSQIISDEAGVQLFMDIPTEKEQIAFNPMDNSSLDSTKIEKLGWKGIFNAHEGFSHTITVMKESL